jgi:hypothetical protein
VAAGPAYHRAPACWCRIPQFPPAFRPGHEHAFPGDIDQAFVCFGVCTVRPEPQNSPWVILTAKSLTSEGRATQKYLDETVIRCIAGYRAARPGRYATQTSAKPSPDTRIKSSTLGPCGSKENSLFEAIEFRPTTWPRRGLRARLTTSSKISNSPRLR